MTNPQKCIIWVAVSTTGQADDDRASLPAQESDALAYAESQGWRVIDILRVPGHSRRYYTIAECAADMRAQGIDAFDRLMMHLNAGDFDVFWCRDADRFGREQSILNEVVTRIIDKGARLYIQNYGWVDSGNFRAVNAMAGLTAATEVDQLQRRAKMGKDAMVTKRGLPTNGKIPESHRVIRDPQSGKITGIELNPDRAQEWQDLAALLLMGTPYHRLADAMFERGYGYRGAPHARYHYHKLLHRPQFWGHVTRNLDRQGMGNWAFLDHEEPPPPIVIHRYAHDPVYTGEQAAAVKAELVRRNSMRGKASPANTHKFTGMVYCDACGYQMSHYEPKAKQYPGRYPAYLRCSSADYSWLPVRCPDHPKIAEPALIAQLTPLLEQVRKVGYLSFVSGNQQGQSTADELSGITADLNTVEDQIRTIISRQAAAPVSLFDLYDEQLRTLAERREVLKARRFDLQAKVNPTQSIEQTHMIDWLRSITVDDLWHMEDRVVNQVLHRLFGKLRIFVAQGQITRIVVPERKKGRRIR